MDVKLNMSIDLSGGDMIEIVTKWAEAQMPEHRVAGVTFKISSGSEDRLGYASPALAGATVRLAPK